MKPLLVGVTALIALLVPFMAKPRVVAIVVPIVEAQSTSSETFATSTSILDLQVMVASESVKFGINPSYSSCIVSHESQWDPTKPGDDGNSRGLWQISKVWHPEVSDAVANNALASTLWSLAWIKAGHAKQWSTYWENCSSTPIF
jgi:hypothetical protein